MDNPKNSSKEDVQKIESLLIQLDVVRSSLPSILRSLSLSSPSPSASPSQQLQLITNKNLAIQQAQIEASEKLERYKGRAKSAFGALKDLRDGVRDCGDVFQRVGDIVGSGGSVGDVEVPKSRVRHQPSPTRARQPTPTKRRLPSRYRYRFPSPKSPRDVFDLVVTMGLEMDPMMSSAGKRVKAWQKGKGKESKAGDEMDISKEDKDGEMKDVVGEQEEDDRPQGIRVIVRGVLSCWIWINWRQRTEDHRGGDGGEHDMDVEGQGNVETVPVVERLVCYGLGERPRVHEQSEHSVFQWITLRGMEIVHSSAFPTCSSSPSPPPAHSNLEEILSWLASYRNLFTAPCEYSSCRAIVSYSHLHVPPTWRVWRVDAGGPGPGERTEDSGNEGTGSWDVFHRACWSQAGALVR